MYSVFNCMPFWEAGRQQLPDFGFGVQVAGENHSIRNPGCEWMARHLEKPDPDLSVKSEKRPNVKIWPRRRIQTVCRVPEGPVEIRDALNRCLRHWQSYAFTDARSATLYLSSDRKRGSGQLICGKVMVIRGKDVVEIITGKPTSQWS